MTNLIAKINNRKQVQNIKRLIFCTLLASFFIATGCRKPLKPDEPGIDPTKEFPIEISFEEYYFEKDSMGVPTNRWRDNSYCRLPVDSLNVINNEEDLIKELFGEGGYHPKVDFSKHTLLIVRGYVENGLLELKKKFIQTSETDYELQVEELFCNVPNLQRRYFALLVDKLSEKSNVKLKLTSFFTEKEQNVTDFETGMYVALNYHHELKLNFIDNETVIWHENGELVNVFKYEICGYRMFLNVFGSPFPIEDWCEKGYGCYFRLINNCKFEMYNWFSMGHPSYEFFDNVIFEKKNNNKLKIK